MRAGDDPAAVLAGIAPVSRDNARTPVHWDSSEKAGFTTGEPWIALAPDHGTVNAAAQVGVPGSVFELVVSECARRTRQTVLKVSRQARKAGNR